MENICNYQQDVLHNRPVYKLTLKSVLDIRSKMMKYMILSMGSGVRRSASPSNPRHDTRSITAMLAQHRCVQPATILNLLYFTQSNLTHHKVEILTFLMMYHTCQKV